MKRKMTKTGHKPNKAFGQVAKEPESKIPGSGKGQMSHMPAGPSKGMGNAADGPKVRTPSAAGSTRRRALEKKLKGVRI